MAQRTRINAIIFLNRMTGFGDGVGLAIGRGITTCCIGGGGGGLVVDRDGTIRGGAGGGGLGPGREGRIGGCGTHEVLLEELAMRPFVRFASAWIALSISLRGICSFEPSAIK